MAELLSLDNCTLLALGPLEASWAHEPLLAFDTSTEVLTLAVCGPVGAFALEVPGGAAASALLLPLAQQLLTRAGLGLPDLRAVAFGSGPGAFTGLRTSCAVAQGLGLGLALPLLPLDSLLLVAEDARLQRIGIEPDAAKGPWTVAVAMDARMNEVYAGRYLWQADAGSADVNTAGQTLAEMAPEHWQVLEAPRLFTLAGLERAWAGVQVSVVAGSALVAFGALLPVPPQALQLPAARSRAAALLRLALRARRAGQGVDAAQALPFYGRDKVAQTTQERQQARVAAAGLESSP